MNSIINYNDNNYSYGYRYVATAVTVATYISTWLCITDNGTVKHITALQTIRQIIPIITWWCNNNAITREISDSMLTGRKPVKMKNEDVSIKFT